jgi:hypothetical protein
MSAPSFMFASNAMEPPAFGLVLEGNTQGVSRTRRQHGASSGPLTRSGKHTADGTGRLQEAVAAVPAADACREQLAVPS